MSCSCSDPFCDGYNCNNNANGGFAIVLFVLLYPYLPFMVVGYELMDDFSNGINLFKWAGAIIGLLLGIYFYFRIFQNFVNDFLNIKSSILYWFICYCLSSFMFVVLNSIYSENKIVEIVSKLWSGFFNWALSVS